MVSLAMQALDWAENDPVGKRQLLKFAIEAGAADAEAGRLLPAEVVFQRVRECAHEE